MAAVVYNGLQTCLESQLRETRILRLRLSSLSSSSPATLESPVIELGFNVDLMTHKKASSGGFSFLHALSDVSQSLVTAEPPEKQSTSTYVHPLQLKRSSLVLSEKSLQLCTESLCNETGINMTENCIDSLEPERDQKEKPAAHFSGAKKTIKMQRFPPPLTTITGSESLTVRPHRDKGRLVVEAVKAPSNATCCFEAERSHGRLRLRFSLSTPTEEDDGNEETDLEEVGKEMESDVFGRGYSEDRSGNKFIDGDNVGIKILINL